MYHNKRNLINFKMKRVNDLKVVARNRSYNNQRALDKLEVMEHVKGQIFNGHIAEIAVFAILGVYQQYENEYFSIKTSLAMDKKHGDISIRTNNSNSTYYLDIKSSYSYQNNRYSYLSNVVVVNFDTLGAINLFNILEKVEITESIVRNKLGKEKFFELLNKVNILWKYYMTEFNLV